MSEPPRDGPAVPLGRRVPLAAAGVLLLASPALAQPADPRPFEVAPADGAVALTVPAMTACLDALRRTGARTAVAAGVSCAVGTTTHPERVGYCHFRPVGGDGLPMLELFREPATHPGRTGVPTGGRPFVYDAGIAAAQPGQPEARVFYFFVRDLVVASMRLTLVPLAAAYDDVPREAPAPVAALLRDGHAVRDACFGPGPVS